MPRGSTLGQEFWRKHNETYEACGQTQQAYCALHGLKAKTFARWRTVFRRSSASTQPRKTKPAPHKPTDHGFVRVHVNDAVAERGVDDVGPADVSSGVVISHGDFRIEISRGFDSITLAAVLSLLSTT